MQELNQIIFLLFALILMGIYISTMTDRKSAPDRYTSTYWRWSLMTRVVSYGTWGLIPLLGNMFLTLANMMVMISVALLFLLFRSWRIKVSRWTEWLCLIFVVVATVWFEILRQQEGTFRGRMALTGMVIVLLDFFSCIELFRYQRIDKTGALKVVIGVVMIQLVLTFTLVFSTWVNSQQGTTLLLQHQSYIVLWGTMSAHLLTYIAVNSYLYQRLLISRRKARLALQEKKLELIVTTKEKEEIATLLAEREELVRSLIQANKTALTGALSASIAHEINQPIGAINLNIEYLKLKLKGNDDETRMIHEVIQSIHHDSDRISAIVSSMRNVFKQEDIQAADIDLNCFVEEMSAIFKSKAKANHVELVIDLQATSLVKLNQDAFQQVILNLINNAIDSVVQTGQVEKKILIKTRDTRDSVELIVSDNGPGVPEERRRALFSLVSSDKESGLGLGLWLSHYIIVRHAGAIRCENNPEGGARFIVSLPISDSMEFEL